MNWLSAPEVAAIPDPEPLIPGWMNRHERFILAGPEKTGKSFAVLQAAFELALGHSLWGSFAVPAPLRVMLLQFEIAPSTFKGRYQGYESALGATDNLWVASDRDFRIDNDSHLAALQRDVATFAPDLFIFDPLYYMHDQPENGDSMKDICRRIDTLSPWCAIWVVHHMSKPLTDAAGRMVSRGRSDIRGHSILIGWPDGIVEIRRGHIADSGLWLRYTLRNQAPVDDTELVKQGPMFVPAPMLTTMGVLSRLRTAGGSLSVAQLAGSRSAVDSLVAQLVHDGLVRDGRTEADKRARVLTITDAGLALTKAGVTSILTAPQPAGTGEPRRQHD